MMKSVLAACALLCAMLPGCARSQSDFLAGVRSIDVAMTREQVGRASWYGAESGKRTASGARFHPEGDTCAMRTHRWHWVTVTVLASGRSARCYVNDYGPHKHTRRLIDVSHGVATKLGFAGAGTAQVSVR